MHKHFLHVLEDFEVVDYVGTFPTCARKIFIG